MDSATSLDVGQEEERREGVFPAGSSGCFFPAVEIYSALECDSLRTITGSTSIFFGCAGEIGAKPQIRAGQSPKPINPQQPEARTRKRTLAKLGP